MGRPARAALAITILASPFLLLAMGADASANSPPSGKIVVEQSGSETQYTASFGDPDGDAVSYEWFPFLDCGTFVPDSDSRRARWLHPDGSDEGSCPHGDGETQSHEGTIILKVSDESGDYTECRYEGSLSGEVTCPSEGEPGPSSSPSTTSSPSPASSPNTSPSPPPPEEDDDACPGFEDSSREQIVGTAQSETLQGTGADEVICGLGGDDILYGHGGDDRLFGGADDDTLRGGLGRDRLTGGPGEDECFGGWGRDRINKSCETP